MKHIYLNLKRFDIPKNLGGVNSIAPIKEWGRYIVENTQEKLKSYKEVEFAMFFPESHLIPAVESKKDYSKINIGTQGLFWDDTAVGGPFGAFTSSLTGNAAKAMGCSYALIGHCEERKKLNSILKEAGVTDSSAVNRILNKEILAAQKAGLNVLYCIGENDTELDAWESVLGSQLSIGLKDADLSKIVIGYEPIWSIGPGKIPAGREYIQKIAVFVKKTTGNLDVVYGGGLKEDNAEMLASIPEIDGGLIALTKFSGEIGFYPNGYLEIVRKYLGE